jgi:hypothetical protein
MSKRALFIFAGAKVIIIFETTKKKEIFLLK